MADVDELAGLLTSARQGDQEAFLRAEEQLAPFVHALIIARTPHHLAGSLVRHVMVQASMRLDKTPDAREFIRVVFELARHMADQTGGAEDLVTEPLMTEARRQLSRLRAMPVTLRERLLMRVLEGLTGPELADLLEVNEDEIRATLDQALSEYLEQPPGSFKSSGYLWSMVGTPPDALVKLENLFTPLRFDLAALSSGEDGPTDVTPVDPVRAVKRNEGRRPTPESVVSVPPPHAGASSGGLKSSQSSHALKPSQSSGALHKPPSSAPRQPPGGLSDTHARHQPETTDPTSSPLAEPIIEAERTDATATSLPPVVETPLVSPLPVPNMGAPAHSSGTVAKTIQASDLPAAAAFDLPVPVMTPRHSPPAVTRAAPPEREADPSHLNPLPAEFARPKTDDDEATMVKPSKVQLSPPTAAVAATPRADDVTTGPTQWRSSKLLEAPPPKVYDNDPSATRAILPPVESFAPRDSLFSSYRPFVVAGVFAAVAIGVVVLMLSGVEQRVKKGWNLVPVLVAASDLPEGTTIGLDSVSQRSVPEQFVTSSVIRPDNTDYVLNQRLLVPVQAGDPLLWSQFESTHAGERLSRKVQLKSRAYTLHAARAAAVGGWVVPGDHVDIVALVKAPQQPPVSVTLLEDLIVLTAGKMTETTLNSSRDRDRDYQNLTLLVVPEEAELLTLASKVAGFKFTLRGEERDSQDYTDRTRYKTGISTLLSGERVKVIQQKRYDILKTIRSAKVRDL